MNLWLGLLSDASFITFFLLGESISTVAGEGTLRES